MSAPWDVIDAEIERWHEDVQRPIIVPDVLGLWHGPLCPDRDDERALKDASELATGAYRILEEQHRSLLFGIHRLRESGGFPAALKSCEEILLDVEENLRTLDWARKGLNAALLRLTRIRHGEVVE